MALVKLYSAHDTFWVNTAQLANLGRTRLTIYTAKGNRLAEVGRTKAIREAASFGVHRDNLYATQKLAHSASERIWRDLFGDDARAAAAATSGN